MLRVVNKVANKAKVVRSLQEISKNLSGNLKMKIPSCEQIQVSPISSHNYPGRHWQGYPLMSDYCVSGIQSKEDLISRKVAQTAHQNCSSRPWSKTVLWLNVLSNLAIDSKGQRGVAFV
jgi:hypothetical protein